MIHIRYFLVTLLSLKVVESAIEGNAVGGKKAVITEFPHSVYLGTTCYEKDSEDSNYWLCGASILNQKVVLTAAHCMYGCGPLSSFSVNMGNVDRNKGFESMVDAYILHEDYNPHKTANDIGLAMIKATIKFKPNIKRIAIMKDPPYFEKAQMAGWGLTDEINVKYDNFLWYIDQYVWENEECLQVLHRMPRGAICASSGNPESYSARGDSGSALVVKNYIQVGIVSYKVPKLSRSLVVYTDTGYFYNWITANAEKLYCA
ncbi:chymotrypsin-1-like isoform X1 [Spodoptera litura]|uniref:Chymotrypsin-1-like isoform X1 n=1 Tax=Spodoptera litura TaxID=69820 RepID=A0A9J7IPZ9_SPOLT|nr:chymotrypsin-1-like isoform X1 [Spodoptera litura]